MTNWPFYSNCVRTGVSIVTSNCITSSLSNSLFCRWALFLPLLLFWNVVFIALLSVSKPLYIFILLLTSLTYVCAWFTCSSVHASTFHPLLAHRHLSYVNHDCCLYDLTFVSEIYVVQLKCHGFISFMFAIAPFRYLLLLTLGCTLPTFPIFCLYLIFCIIDLMCPIFCVFIKIVMLASAQNLHSSFLCQTNIVMRLTWGMII